MTWTLTQDGSRLYLSGGNTFAVKEQLRAAGCHWEPERKQYWIGVTKRAALEQVLAALTPPSEAQQEAARLTHDQGNILGQATYAEKSYYLVGQGTGARGPWVRLMFRDGSQTFFKPAGEVEITKQYARAQTLSGLREYAARRKREAAGGACECWCHTSTQCTCERGFCSFHHDSCDSCGCES